MKSDRGILKISAQSDVGRRRPHNEDNFLADADMGLVVVADGMGGHNAGEVASEIAIKTIRETIETQWETPTETSSPPEEETISEEYTRQSLLIRDAITKSNQAILSAAQENPHYEGMGTTIVSALFYEDRVTIAHVGDSRIYRWRSQTLEQLTVDHSLAQELVLQGYYKSYEEATRAGIRNVLTRALGVGESVDIDLQEDLVLPDDIYLLCSDGLTDMVSEEEIQLTLNMFSTDLERASGELVKIANSNGGVDNITVILAQPIRQSISVQPQKWYSKLFGWLFG